MSTTALERAADIVVRVSPDDADHALTALAGAVADMEARLKGKAPATPYLLVVDNAGDLLGPQAPSALARVMALANRGGPVNMRVVLRGDVYRMPDSVVYAQGDDLLDIEPGPAR